MKKILSVMLCLLLATAVFAAGKSEGTPGITKTEIIIGNTAATTGVFAGVGVPFNLAMQVVFDKYNAANPGKRQIVFKHYDDGFDGEKGLAFTKKLVEEDKVFALVGHFGTNTVNATMDYLLETQVPMVYGVTGVNSLFFENVPGNNILSVQPIFRTEGRMLVARALHESLFGAAQNAKLGAAEKIVVLYSDDDAGQSIKLGVTDEVAKSGIASRVTYLPFDAATASAIASVALDLKPGVILLSSNQAPATAMATALRIAGSKVPVLSSYVNGAAVFTPAMENAKTALPYNVYANSWIDIASAAAAGPTEAQIGGPLAGWDYPLNLLAGFTSEYWETFVKDMNTSKRVDGETTARSLWANAYAMAGYVAAETFVQVLKRVDLDTVTWDSFIAKAESAPVKLPMSGAISWAKGSRVGLSMLGLVKLNYGATVTFVAIEKLEAIETVRAK